MTLEEWRPIIGYEGVYEVSNNGRVRSFRRPGNPKDRIINPAVNSGGYRTVQLHKDGHRKTKKVSRLVAEMFIPNPKNLRVVHHRDGRKTNDVAGNLEWVTDSQNILADYWAGRQSSVGTKNANAKLTEREVLFIRWIKEKYPGIKNPVIAEFYGITPTAISDICTFKRWRHL